MPCYIALQHITRICSKTKHSLHALRFLVAHGLTYDVVRATTVSRLLYAWWRGFVGQRDKMRFQSVMSRLICHRCPRNLIFFDGLCMEAGTRLFSAILRNPRTFPPDI